MDNEVAYHKTWPFSEMGRQEGFFKVFNYICIFKMNLISEAYASIIGSKEKVFRTGSEMQLVCIIKDITQAPTYIFWYALTFYSFYRVVRCINICIINSLTRIPLTNYTFFQVPWLPNDQLWRSVRGQCCCFSHNKSHPPVGADYLLNHHVPWGNVLLLPQPGQVRLCSYKSEAQGGGAAWACS